MGDEDVFNEIRAIIENFFRKKDLVIRRETVASDVDGWDSLAHALLVLRIEKAFGVKLPAAEVGRVRCVGDLVDLVKATRGA